jgi:hypothetical protein
VTIDNLARLAVDGDEHAVKDALNAYTGSLSPCCKVEMRDYEVEPLMVCPNCMKCYGRLHVTDARMYFGSCE